MTGQTGRGHRAKEISAAAKALKNFAAEFDKLKVKFGYLDNQRLEEAAIKVLADLPSLDVLRAKLLGLLNSPATKLVTLINTPRRNSRRYQGEGGEGSKRFPATLPVAGRHNNLQQRKSTDQNNNNNVNRRLRARELKSGVAVADDETTRKVIWLTLETS